MINKVFKIKDRNILLTYGLFLIILSQILVINSSSSFDSLIKTHNPSENLDIYEKNKVLQSDTENLPNNCYLLCIHGYYGYNEQFDNLENFLFWVLIC